ncbi:Hydroxyproline-rich glycoprotein family protein [Hirschfeldia incana]|nr:Hydroxyproline-rich glycoprotein family protein [Hirschfeldia incana]
MNLGGTIIATALLIMLALVSGEISTKSSSPAPAPDLPGDAVDSPPIHAPAPELGSPPSVNSPSPAESPIHYSSPPEPEHSPSHSPSDSPSTSPPMPDDDQSTTPSPSPSPEPSDVNHSDITGRVEEKKPSGGGGMSGGTKAGVAFGTIAAVCVVGLAGFVYKKRQDNIRRSRYGYAARDIL